MLTPYGQCNITFHPILQKHNYYCRGTYTALLCTPELWKR